MRCPTTTCRSARRATARSRRRTNNRVRAAPRAAREAARGRARPRGHAGRPAQGRGMTTRFELAPAPHARALVGVPLVMRRVLYALVPAAITYTWFFGWGLPINFAIAAVTALLSEGAVLRLRGRRTRVALNDGSALVTAALLSFALPPLVPAWIPALSFEQLRGGSLFGDFGGRGWEWVANLIALGGLYLLYTGTIRWQIPFALLAGLLLPATVFYVLDSDHYAAPGFHLFSGASMLGAFFIATDPVSAAASDRGRLVYGACIGALTYAIRTWGGYPDGIAFSVLLLNAAVPIIDRYTRPRIYGQR